MLDRILKALFPDLFFRSDVSRKKDAAWFFRVSFSTMLKITVHQLSPTARSRPIRATDGSGPANDDA